MNKEEFKNLLADLRYLTLVPRRYSTRQGLSAEYWGKVDRRYANAEKAVETSAYHWRVVEYKDGHKELTYLRVLQNGIVSGMAPALYRGLIIPRRIRLGTFDHVKDIRLAF